MSNTSFINLASRLIKIRPLDIFSNQFPFSCYECPRKWHLTDRRPLFFKAKTYPWQPNTFRFANSGFLPVHTWCADLSRLMANVGHRFWRNVAVIIASHQNSLNTSACSIIQRAHSTTSGSFFPRCHSDEAWCKLLLDAAILES